MVRVLVVLAILSALIPVARAEPAPATAVPTGQAPAAQAPLSLDDDKPTWERLLEDGERLFAADADYPAALDRFRRSYQLQPSARALNGIVVVQQLQGQHVEAYEGLERLLREFGSTLTAGQSARIQRRLDEQRAVIGVIAVRAAQPGARVLVDGREIGFGPLTASVRVLPGTHAVIATRPGHDPVTRSVAVGAGSTAAVVIELRPTPVRVERPVMVRPMNAWIPWLTLGAGAAVVGAGIGFRVSAASDLDRAELLVRQMSDPDQRPVDITKLPEFQRAELKNTTAISLWVAGGAAVVTGAVLAILNQPRPLAEHRAVIVPTGRGAVLHVSF